MSIGEFELIGRYFADSAAARRADPGVVLGIGDDAAILRVPEGHDLVVSIDTLVSGVHFPEYLGPRDVGWRALAVNLGDLAAMGAEPLWFTLALTLPQPDEAWLAAFSAGLCELALDAGITLVGGDTTRGPLSITVQVHGSVPRDAALRRDRAQPGDLVWVSGCPGTAASGLRLLLAGDTQPRAALDAFLRPQPRLALGVRLRGIASAAIDISDGLLADAGHIAEMSGVAIVLDREALPLSPALQAIAGLEEARALCLSGGDDYELCFTLPPRNEKLLAPLADEFGLRLSRIGRVVAGSGASCPGVVLSHHGYRHFGE